MSPEQLKIWDQFIPGEIQPLPFFENNDVSIKRLDLIRSWVEGNKYYKLKYNIAEVLHSKIPAIVSKGGMFSNHLFSLSKACRTFTLQCIAIIRSYSDDIDNPTLAELRREGCDLHFLPPQEFNAFNESECAGLFPGAFFIPEGGANDLGIMGASELGVECMEILPDYILLAGGTLSTALGMLKTLQSSTHLIIVPAWKGCTYDYVVKQLAAGRITPSCQWSLWDQYHHGGFGKSSRELAAFMHVFTDQTNIPLDPVYNGKLMYALQDQIRNKYFNKEDKILVIHSGGLQGIAGYKYRDPETWNSYLP